MIQWGHLLYIDDMATYGMSNVCIQGELLSEQKKYISS